jgi:hypothetical protein
MLYAAAASSGHLSPAIAHFLAWAVIIAVIGGVLLGLVRVLGFGR